MKKQHLRQIQKSIQIVAPKLQVWDILLSPETFPIWAAAFAPGSVAVTDWHEGGHALFLDGKGTGMVSRIASHVTAEHITIEHAGVVINGKEYYDTEEAMAWRGAKESYFVTETDGVTTLIVESEVLSPYYDEFNESWDQALLIIKDLAEKK